jgi:hypothetical protein
LKPQQQRAKSEGSKMEKTKEVKKVSKIQKIKPLKDFVIKQNDFYYEIKKGESIEIDKRFLPNLKTEKVIK